VIKSRRKICAGEGRGAYMASVGKPERERDHFEDVDMDWRIILKWIYERNGIDLAYDRDKMQAFGSIGISLWVP
jgi:hypothetical protein